MLDPKQNQEIKDEITKNLIKFGIEIGGICGIIFLIYSGYASIMATIALVLLIFIIGGILSVYLINWLIG